MSEHAYTPDDGQGEVSPVLVELALVELVKAGTAPAELACSRLAQMTPWSHLPTPLRARQLEIALDTAVERLGEGDWHRAGRALLGLSAGEHGLPLKRRRRAAAAALSIEVVTFRRYYEQKLTREIAWQLAILLLEEFAQGQL